MNKSTSKAIRKKAKESKDPQKAYKILKGMITGKEITLLEMERIDLN